MSVASVREQRRLRREAIVATLGPCTICGGPIPFGKPGVNMRSKTCGRKCAVRRANEKQWARDKRRTRDHRRYWKATGRGHTYRRHRLDDRPRECKVCGSAMEQPRTSKRLFCGEPCRARHFRARHPYVPVVPFEPLPMPYVGHPVFEQAAKVANLTSSSYSVDWGQNDILGEAVLAILEGRDPGQAVRAVRAAMKGDDMRRAWGVADFGSDGDGNIITVKDYDGE